MGNYTYRFNPISGEFDIVQDLSLIHVKDPVDTYNDLPITGNAENDARFVKDTDILYVWTIANPSGSLSDWKETAKLSIADLDALPDGATYGRVKNTELESGQVKRLDDGTNEIEVNEILKATTSAITYWIDCDNGDDENEGTEAFPFATIQHAIDLIPKIVKHPVTIFLKDSLNYNEQLRIYKFVIIDSFEIVGSGENPDNVLISGDPTKAHTINISQCVGMITLLGLSIKAHKSNGSCIYANRIETLKIVKCKFSSGGYSNVTGIWAMNSTVKIYEGFHDYDENLVTNALRAMNSIIFCSNFSDDLVKDRSIVEEAGIIADYIAQPGARIDAAVEKTHTHTDQNLDLGTGELKIKVFAQASEPALNADEFMAIWKNTSVSGLPSVYLIFRRGVGDQVKVELI